MITSNKIPTHNPHNFHQTNPIHIQKINYLQFQPRSRGIKNYKKCVPRISSPRVLRSTVNFFVVHVSSSEFFGAPWKYTSVHTGILKGSLTGVPSVDISSISSLLKFQLINHLKIQTNLLSNIFN